MAEKDLVWDELELDDLLDLGRKSIAAQQAEAQIQKSKALLKQQKLIQKPGFNVLMDRYNSLPTKPKSISKSKLAQLADPILGRLTHNEKQKYQSLVSRKGDYAIISEDPKVKKIVLSINEEEGDVRFSHIPAKKSKNDGGFFMTEAAADGDDDDSFGKAPQRSPLRQRDGKSRIQSNISNSKNGFASMLRNRVHDAKKVNKLSKPLELYKGRSDDLDESVKRNELTNAYKQRLDKLKKANKEIYERNKNSLKRVKNKRNALGLDSSMSESSQTSKVRKVGVVRDPNTGRIKKVCSSGYGKLVQRYSNQPKPRNPKRVKSVDMKSNDGNISDITPGSTPNKPTVANQTRKNLPKASSLAVIEEQPEEIPKPLTKKLSSSSAPHLNRNKSKAKLPTIGSKINEVSSNSKQADVSNNISKKRVIRSAGALRIAKENDDAEILMKVVEAKRKSSTNEELVSAHQNEILPTASASPGKSNYRLEPIVENILPTYPSQTVIDNISPQKIEKSEKKVTEDNIQDLLQRDQTKITDDIAASIQKLQQFEKSIINGDMYCKPDTNAILARRAEKLGGHLTAAESILAEYESLKDF